MSGLTACRCPGRFLAEAEVALIALLLLSRYRPELRPAESTPDSGEDVICHGASRAKPRLSAKQQEHRGMGRSAREHNGASLGTHVGAESVSFREGGSSAMSAAASSCPSDSGPSAAQSSANSWRSEEGVLGSSAQGKQARRSDMLCSQTLIDHEEKSSAECSPEILVLPLPELRRQVGVRWPQHDINIRLGD